ncbi:MAG: hypothetical protein VCE43_21875 [Myxococcota bacterium]
MHDTSLLQLAASTHERCYRVSVLSEASPSEQGIRYRQLGGFRMLEWGMVQTALAGEVGEPEGVRTIIFDLVIDRVVTPQGVRFSVCRLDAEPGEAAMNLAKAISGAIRDNASPSIKSLAADGCPSLWYPDLEEFEVAAVQSLSR